MRISHCRHWETEVWFTTPWVYHTRKEKLSEEHRVDYSLHYNVLYKEYQAVPVPGSQWCSDGRGLRGTGNTQPTVSEMSVCVSFHRSHFPSCIFFLIFQDPSVYFHREHLWFILVCDHVRSFIRRIQSMNHSCRPGSFLTCGYNVVTMHSSLYTPLRLSDFLWHCHYSGSASSDLEMDFNIYKKGHNNSLRHASANSQPKSVVLSCYCAFMLNQTQRTTTRKRMSSKPPSSPSK